MQLTKMESPKLDVIAVYRSEQGNSVELLDHIKDLITPMKSTVIFGDFNICYLSTRNNRITKYLEQNGFKQLVKEATHIRGRLLDHFYIRQNENNVVSNIANFVLFSSSLISKLHIPLETSNNLKTIGRMNDSNNIELSFDFKSRPQREKKRKIFSFHQSLITMVAGEICEACKL